MKHLATIAFAFLFVARCSSAEKPLDFKEVFEVLRANLPGVSEVELTNAAARGLISQLRPRVTLVADAAVTNGVNTNLTALRTATYDQSYGYLRLGAVVDGSAKRFNDALGGLRTNKLKGLVLDLRFSGGDDYAAAAEIADRFFTSERPLIDYGQGLKSSTAKSSAATMPVAILVNTKTAGASEALAGILRHNEVGLLIGETTAGEASISRTVTLRTGQSLRIVTTPIKAGNGHPLPISGLKPDISVDVNPDDTIAYIEDAYKPSATTAQAGPATNETAAATTNRVPRRRINEAELVRMLRDGQNPDAETASAARRSARAEPAVQDPALARAIDLLKGLAVLQQARSL